MWLCSLIVRLSDWLLSWAGLLSGSGSKSFESRKETHHQIQATMSPLTKTITSARVVEKSVKVNDNSPSHSNSPLDDQTIRCKFVWNFALGKLFSFWNVYYSCFYRICYSLNFSHAFVSFTDDEKWQVLTEFKVVCIDGARFLIRVEWSGV